jgi:hypothetical protein
MHNSAAFLIRILQNFAWLANYHMKNLISLRKFDPIIFEVIKWVSEWVSDCLTSTQQFFRYIMTEQVNFQCNDDEVCFVLVQHA